MAESRHRILIVDDESAIVEALSLVPVRRRPGDPQRLGAGGARRLIEKGSVDLVIADLKLTGVFGLEGFQLLTFVREHSPQTAVILLTAFGTAEIEAEAYRRGARFFFHKRCHVHPRGRCGLWDTVARNEDPRDAGICSTAQIAHGPGPGAWGLVRKKAI